MVRYRKAQAETQDVARSNGAEWTMPELELLERDDVSNLDCARMLGRTYSAVATMRWRLRTEPGWARP